LGIQDHNKDDPQKHLELWDQKAKPPPKANTLRMAQEYNIEYTDSQVPVFDNYLYMKLSCISPAWHIHQFHARLEDVSLTFFWDYLDKNPVY
jgi:hypothetical protein